MTRFSTIAALLFVTLIGVSCLFYAFKECGFGALAYKNPVIAATTGQCK